VRQTAREDALRKALETSLAKQRQAEPERGAVSQQQATSRELRAAHAHRNSQFAIIKQTSEVWRHKYEKAHKMANEFDAEIERLKRVHREELLAEQQKGAHEHERRLHFEHRHKQLVNILTDGDLAHVKLPEHLNVFWTELVKDNVRLKRRLARLDQERPRKVNLHVFPLLPNTPIVQKMNGRRSSAL